MKYFINNVYGDRETDIENRPMGMGGGEVGEYQWKDLSAKFSEQMHTFA